MLYRMQFPLFIMQLLRKTREGKEVLDWLEANICKFNVITSSSWLQFWFAAFYTFAMNDWTWWSTWSVPAGELNLMPPLFQKTRYDYWTGILPRITEHDCGADEKRETFGALRLSQFAEEGYSSCSFQLQSPF